MPNDLAFIVFGMNVFYSWQADTPNAIGRSFIRQALDDAVKTLTETLDLEEADRPTIDQDTQGVMGSPVIAETIYEKIRDSQVVVADVTLTCATPEGKKLINSNVAYELGYAHGHHGHGVILSVMNTHYGPPNDLPFDLQHRRWPVQFEIAPDAEKTDRREVRKALAKEFARILQLYLEGKNPGKKYEPTQSTINAASYWREGELLVQADPSYDNDEPIALGFDKDQPLCYLRIWPDTPLEELSGREIGDYNLSSIEPLLGRTGGYSHHRNRYGVFTYGGREGAELIASTQLFKNREIWGVDAFVLRPRDNFDVDFLATGAFENGMIRSFGEYLKRAFDKLGYPDLIHVEAGMVNVDGFMLAMPNQYFDKFWGPIFEDVSVSVVIDKNDPETITAVLLKLFEAVFDAAGKERPANYNNFPPMTT